ncbi:hypothetical protein EDD18DRAFT_1329638 [Armillaria luteobubalina]|uniref:Uncharacterized protein n=1 Tax=Armillaria luteobubalina TaxID=153913 RepID=A0AA39QBG1_9AGAR|nr:hypothetical protein EDD18DRAFT_1329638 [Armillaria luteobubalina]
MSGVSSEYIPSPGRASGTYTFSWPTASESALPTASFRPTIYRPPTIVQCHDPVARGLATVAVIFAIGLLIFITLLVLRLQKLNARMRHWELAGDGHEVLFQAPSDGSEHGDEKKALLGGVVEQELAEETQAGSIVSEDGRRSELSAKGEGSQPSRKG